MTNRKRTDRETKLWKELRDPECTNCELYSEAQCVCLMGEGSGKLGMIVGEAPGYREVELEKPFCGKAGQLLREMMSSIGLDPHDFYITNVVKCRPPGNRTPEKEETESCAWYLEREIEVMDPPVIFTLGNVALKALTGKSGITKRRGQVLTSELTEGKVLPSVHPAYVLRNTGAHGLLLEDLKKLKGMVKGKQDRSAIDPKIIIVKNLQGLGKLERILAAYDGPIGYDIETTGLDRYMEDGRVLSIAFGLWKARKAYVVFLEHPLVARENPMGAREDYLPDGYWTQLNRIFDLPKKWVAQNGKFDNLWLRHRFKICPRLYADTKLMARLLDENRSNSLKPLAQSYLGASAYADEVDVNNLLEADPKKLARYNGLDAFYTAGLYEKLKSEMKREPQLAKVYLKIVLPAARLFEEVEQTGVHINRDLLQRTTVATERVMEQLEEELIGLWGSDSGFNPRSSRDCQELIFETLGVKPDKSYDGHKTPKGELSTRSEHLQRVEDQHPGVSVLLQYRILQKVYASALLSWEEKLVFHGRYGYRIHPRFNILGTVTGRLSSENPNFQQVPRANLVRNIIGPSDGYKFIELDLSQAELRVAAVVANDKAMKRVFQTGGDIHAETASDFVGRPPDKVTPEERKRAKAVNFGLTFGMSPKGLMEYGREKYGVKMTLREATAYHESFFNKYKGLRRYHAEQAKRLLELGYVDSPFGRRRRFGPPELLAKARQERSSAWSNAWREAINHPIQSAAHDIALWSAVLLGDMIYGPNRVFQPESVRMVGELHDAIFYEVKESFVDQFLPVALGVVEAVPKGLAAEFGYEFDVPVLADSKVGDFWQGQRY